jgi:hypothetical protein
MTNFAKLVPIPSLDTVNIGLSPAHQATMLKIFGKPGVLSEDCSDITNSKLEALIETRNVGPFKATGIGRLLDDLTEIFAEVKTKLPEVFSQVKTDGMLCCRAVRGSTTNFSNHSWGTAIDIRFGDDSDEMGDGLMQLGSSALAPFFHVRGWYWGVGFAQSNPKREDSMHFEASDELIRQLFGGESGLVDLTGAAVVPEPTDGGLEPTEESGILKSDLLARDARLEAVAEGHGVLVASGGLVEGIGPVQDALNLLAKSNPALVSIDLGPADKFRGFFGEKTEAAIEAFQTFAALDVDGRVGRDTIRKLDESLTGSAAGGEAPATGAPMPTGKFAKTLKQVFNRGSPKPAFLQELVAWGKTAPEAIFADQPGNEKDIYASVTEELGPFGDITHRKACMLEVMRVLAGFESSWDFNEGIDTSRVSEDTPQNSEAGAWQVSADSLAVGKDLKDLVKREAGTLDGIEFQRAMKSNHPLAMEYIARLMRHTRMANGPLYKGTERSKLSQRVRGQEQSIYPWLSREAVAEFQAFLA